MSKNIQATKTHKKPVIYSQTPSPKRFNSQTYQGARYLIHILVIKTHHNINMAVEIIWGSRYLPFCATTHLGRRVVPELLTGTTDIRLHRSVLSLT